MDFHTSKCTKHGCNGYKVIPLDSRLRHVIFNRVCNGTIERYDGKGNVYQEACGSYDTRIYRWVSQRDKTKLTFDSPETVRKYGLKGRTFYSTLMIFDKSVLPASMNYVQENTYKAYSLGIDVDVVREKGETICDYNNREDIDKCLDVIRDEFLDIVCPNSYNLHSSGNGVQIMIHHLLCQNNIYQMIARFNAYLKYLNQKCHDAGVKRAKVDSINMNNRLFKMPFSIHQYYDFVCIPLPYDVHLTNMYADDFKLKYFDIDKFITDDNKLQFYNRYKVSEAASLYKFLMNDTNFAEGTWHGIRALRYEVNEANIAITGETKELEDEGENETELPKIDLGGWIRYDYAIPVGGEVIYRVNEHNELEIEMFGIKDANKIKQITKDIKQKLKR